MGRRLNTDLLNSAENENFSGRYPELIYSVGGCTLLDACTAAIWSCSPPEGLGVLGP